MEASRSEAYAAAGVDITAGYKAVELMKAHIARTMTAGVGSNIGGFGGLFELDTRGMERPVLVSGTDGVGTKLKLAFLADKHDTVGIDCVAMCVNDIICCGAKPLFFLDYIACASTFLNVLICSISAATNLSVYSAPLLIHLKSSASTSISANSLALSNQWSCQNLPMKKEAQVEAAASVPANWIRSSKRQPMRLFFRSRVLPA